MKFFTPFSSLILAGFALGLPASELGDITGKVISEGLGEDGVPYAITHGNRKLSDDEITKWNEGYTSGESDNNTTALTKRGFGAGGNCNQVYDNKYCFCGGAISNRGDCYWGSQDHCGEVAVDRGHAGVLGKTETYTVKWLPTVKIEYRIKNFCDETYTLRFDDCGANFLSLIDWCEWTWMSQKGGYWRIHECFQFDFDVNSR